ncbi:proteasome accessory factor C [Marmoricola sp. OAE513]|uniref:helix-turn-helix transcriptional regulator n=1 Tax=Marmoricola sp. OAE513 TaxID=2817894 RepID=UPI001AE1E729
MSGASTKDQLSRLLALAPYLQTRGAVSLKEVAADFGVSREQMLKDLRVLYLCGLPGFGPGDLIEINVEALIDDPDGMVRIDNAEFLARPLRLGSDEASALIVGLRTLQESSPHASRELVARTLAKLEAATGREAVPVVDIRNPETRPAVVQTRATLETAIAGDRQARLKYVVPSRDEVTERVVDPGALLARDGHVYLDAWCHLADARRLFRVDRVAEVELLETPRSTPQLTPRNLADGLYEAGPDDVEARLRLSPQMRWFAEHYPVLSVQDAPDGSSEVTLAIGDEQWLLRLAFRYNEGLEVLEPIALRDRIRAVAADALRLQQGTA